MFTFRMPRYYCIFPFPVPSSYPNKSVPVKHAIGGIKADSTSKHLNTGIVDSRVAALAPLGDAARNAAGLAMKRNGTERNSVTPKAGNIGGHHHHIIA
jgi:hypothetical protein